MCVCVCVCVHVSVCMRVCLSNSTQTFPNTWMQNTSNYFTDSSLSLQVTHWQVVKEVCILDSHQLEFHAGWASGLVLAWSAICMLVPQEHVHLFHMQCCSSFHHTPVDDFMVHILRGNITSLSERGGGGGEE